MLALILLAAPGLAQNAVRIQAEGVAKLPPRVPGAPAPKPLDAAAFQALRQSAVADGIENAVLAHARELARLDVRDDEDALRAALGPKLAELALGHGVLADLGPREAKPKQRPGDPPPRPRKAGDPIPMEHAWRVEALVDSPRVRAALEAAGLALVSAADSAAHAELVLEAPYDAAMLAALRAKLTALGARSVVPRRYEAAGVTLSVRGLPDDRLRRRLAAEPPAGYTADVLPREGDFGPTRVRLSASPRS
ncbi:MAG TPA: hypothetical protein VFT98_10495 [Myxococcota bacterium]|nr:hypothetical protein [Myxococcota bacterium]